jgi:GNAT superfamily N-acetyltransferase
MWPLRWCNERIAAPMSGTVSAMTSVRYVWRGAFTNREANALHADAFGHRVYDDAEWDWQRLCREHSLGWVTARRGEFLVGFVNVAWDGFVHAWLQDEMVASDAKRQGIGLALIREATTGAKAAGCEWLHVDFDDDLRPFYLGAAGFTETNAGLIDLTNLD